MVGEAATAWEAIFERQRDGFPSWRPTPDHARYAFEAFREFADREVAASDVPDADSLLYRCGPLGSGAGALFRLSFIRQLATDPDGGLAQVECRLDFVMTAGLAALGSFDQWWFPAHDQPHGQPRDRWFGALAARPEWPLLNTLSPSAFEFVTRDPG